MLNLILDAAQYARDMHSGQVRKYTGEPYIWHPGRVAARTCLLEQATPEMVAAAWLHDVVEDCTSPNIPSQMLSAEIMKKFGGEVLKLVLELTFDPDSTLKNNGVPRKARKAMQAEKIGRASNRAKTLKLLDRIDNLRDLDKCDDPEYIAMYKEESRDLLKAIRVVDYDFALLDELRAILG